MDLALHLLADGEWHHRRPVAEAMAEATGIEVKTAVNVLGGMKGYGIVDVWSARRGAKVRMTVLGEQWARAQRPHAQVGQ